MICKGLVFGLLVALTACTDPATQTMKDAVAQCKADYPAEKGTLRARAVCERDAVQAWGHESADLDYYDDQRVVLGGKVDAGTVSLDEASAQLAGLKAQLISGEQERAAQDQEARAQSIAAAAAVLQATTPPPPPLQPLQFYNPPLYVPPPVRPMVNTNCYTMANQTSCQSY